MKKTSKKKDQSRKAVSVVPPQRSAKNLAILERLRTEHRYLRDRLNAPERLAPFIGLRERGMDPQTVLKQLQDRLNRIRELKAKAERTTSIIARPPVQALPGPNAPLPVAGQGSVPAFTCVDGSVNRATQQFCFYIDSTGPSANCPTIALRRDGGITGWWEPVWPEAPSNATGFAAYIESGNGIPPLGASDLIWFIPCFQFTFPNFSKDGVLRWSLVLSVICGFELDADSGYASFQPCISEQPQGGKFPQFEAFSWISDTRYITKSLPSNVYEGQRFELNGAFNVRANIESKLCVGLGVLLWVASGGFLNIDSGRAGIPNCSRGKTATVNDPLWEWGVIDVCWDTGRLGIEQYQEGVKYTTVMPG